MGFRSRFAPPSSARALGWAVAIAAVAGWMLAAPAAGISAAESPPAPKAPAPDAGKADVKPDARPAAKPDAKPDAKAGAKPDAKPDAKAGAKPITKASGRIGDLLRRWYAEGTAAGNEGDYYDNRDRAHSGLDLGPYPQLTKVEYSEADRARRLDWALQGRVLPHVVFGNSSTSSGVTTGGCNARMAYSHPMALAMLYAQYTHSNLYIYPEHQDYDPGHNGKPGYGDVFPTNTPCLIVSQGSSGSDQPFMRAIPFALAAFRPEVKKKLVESGLLAPTLQMILRLTGKPIADPKDYLTGKAHPTVFDGSWVDDLKMVELAHAIRLDDIPPMVQLRAAEEAEAALGRDYFDLASCERLGDTPAVIARVHRRRDRDYRLVVSAEGSFDANKRPLAWHWVVLRGDAARIRLTPQNPAGSVCEIVVPWHDRRPVAEGSAIESNRVDIGVFVHNGAYYSAPGFVTFLHLDEEGRTYADDGRILEIGYGLGTTAVSVANWTALFDLFKPDADSLGARLLKQRFKDAEIAAVLRAAEEYRKAKALADAGADERKLAQANRQKTAEALKAAERARDEAKAAHEKAPTDHTRTVLEASESVCAAAKDAVAGAEAHDKEAGKAADEAAKAAREVVEKKRDDLPAPIRELVENILAELAASPSFYPDHLAEMAAAQADAGPKGALDAARRRLVGFGLLKDGPANAFDLTPLTEGAGPAAARLTRYEKSLVEQFNGEVLGRVVYAGAVHFSFQKNYVDPRFATPRSWRDVYQYNQKGDGTGWTRYDGRERTEFDPWGLVVLARDALGRCAKAQAVRYEREPAGKDPRHQPPGPLRWVLETGITHYEYADANDWRGRVKAEPLPPTGL